MVATNWSTSEGFEYKRSAESMWLKIVSQWVFLLLYCKILHVAYLTNSD
jgi:Serine incorporator (Serinc)